MPFWILMGRSGGTGRGPTTALACWTLDSSGRVFSTANIISWMMRRILRATPSAAGPLATGDQLAGRAATQFILEEDLVSKIDN